MNNNNFSEESQDLLSLGTLHEEVEKKRVRQKIGKLPVILIVIGLLLMLVGFFYNDIEKVVKGFINNQKTKTEIKKDSSITYLDCTYDKNDSSLGLKNKVNIKYEFKDNKLKRTSTILTMSILDNSYEIGINNIKVYHNKYNTALSNISISGLIIKNELKDDKFINTVLVDYDVLDTKLVPKVDYLSITNKKDQTYREIKELEGRAGHICKVS